MKKSVVFIHGLGLGDWVFRENYQPYYQALGYEVHTVNLPGHTGDATMADRQRVTLDACVNFVHDYLQTRVSGPYVLAGLSMGGAICQKLLDKKLYDHNLKGVVLLSSVPPANNLIFTLRLCKQLALSDSQVLVDFFTDNTNQKLMFSPQNLAAMPQTQIQGYVGKVLKGFSRLEYELFFQDLVSGARVPEVPLKVIGGEQDMLFPPEVVRFTAAYYSQQSVIIPHAGHLMPIESNYKQGIHAIDSFLKEVF